MVGHFVAGMLKFCGNPAMTDRPSDRGIAQFVEKAAQLISGAPFPSRRSLTKARELFELVYSTFLMPQNAAAPDGAPSQDDEYAPDSDWRLKGYVYASKQATLCAGCGEHKHTPLRVDWMGGYVCLTCIDKEMEKRDPDEGLLAAVNSACGELPDGWSIELNIENGYGGIELFNDEGEKIPSEECLVDDCTLAEDIGNAVQFAIDAARAARGGG